MSTVQFMHDIPTEEIDYEMFSMIPLLPLIPIEQLSVSGERRLTT